MSIRDLLRYTLISLLYGFVASLGLIAFIVLDISFAVKLICLIVIIICLLIYNIYCLINNYKGIITLLVSVIYELASAFISFFIFSMFLWTIFDIHIIGID